MSAWAVDSNFDLVESGIRTDLVVTGDWSTKAAKALSGGRADGLVLNYAKGYRERTLKFLEDWPLRRIRILARTLADLTPVYRMAATLESGGVITAPKARLDLSRREYSPSIAVVQAHLARSSRPVRPSWCRS